MSLSSAQVDEGVAKHCMVHMLARTGARVDSALRVDIDTSGLDACRRSKRGRCGGACCVAQTHSCTRACSCSNLNRFTCWSSRISFSWHTWQPGVGAACVDEASSAPSRRMAAHDQVQQSQRQHDIDTSESDGARDVRARVQ